MATIYYISDSLGATNMGLAGCYDLIISRKTGAVSQASWSQTTSIDNSPSWSYGTYITLSRSIDGGDQETLFQGWITLADSTGEDSKETLNYTASDAWYHFEHEIYRASRQVVDDAGDLAAVLMGRTLLGMASDGTRLTAQAIIAAVRSFASSLGITLSAGTFDAPITPPWDEVIDRTLAEIILRVLRWQPDAVCWVDHATTPPTLNVTRRANMSEVTIPITTPDSCRIRAYPELQVPGVVISFESSNAHGRTISTQTAGDTTALGCARMTIPLEFEAGAPGPKQEIKVVALGEYSTLSWWRVIFPWIPEDAEITAVTIDPEPAEDYTNILTAGVIQQWMTDELDLGASNHRISCKMSGTVDGHTYTEKALSRDFTLTNAKTKRYIGRFTPSWSESEPTSLASSFYTAASALQYGGRLLIIEAECTIGRTLLGKKINISGGPSDWATMGAAVVAIDEDFDKGETVITLGPQQHLGIQDLIELIRCSRLRSTWSPLSPLGVERCQ